MDASLLCEASKVKGKGKGKGKSSAANKTDRTNVARSEPKQTVAGPSPCNSMVNESTHDSCDVEEKASIRNNSELITHDKNTLSPESTENSNTVSVIVSNPKIGISGDMHAMKPLDIISRPSADKNVELAKRVLFPSEPKQPDPIREEQRADNLDEVEKEESLYPVDMSYVASVETVESKYKYSFKKRVLEEWANTKSAMVCESSISPEPNSPVLFQDAGSDMETEDWCTCLPEPKCESLNTDPETNETDCVKKLCRKRLYEKPNPNSAASKKSRSSDLRALIGRATLDANTSVNLNALSSPDPADLQQWIKKYESWTSAEKNRALDALIKSSTILQVRYMMKTIEPLFQTDFISLLPKELALIVLSYLEPNDLAKVAQTCRYWRFLANDYLLWKKLCRRIGLTPTSPVGTFMFDRPPSVNPYKWAFMYQHVIERNWMTLPSSEAVIMRGHDDHVITCLQCDGDRIVSGSDDTTLKVWSTVTGECLLTLFGHSGGVWSCQMTDDVIVSGSTDRTLRVWNADTGVCLNTLGGHTSTVRCMRLFEDKVVSGSRDATLRVWSIPEGRCLRVLVGHLAAVRCVQYDGKLVVSGAYDFFVKIWNPDTGECLHTLAGHTNRVYSLQFDGANVVSGSLDTSICVWDAKTGQLKHTLVGHTSLITSMELHGNTLISGNADSTLKVWDISTGQCLHTLAGTNKHQSAVTYVQSTNRFVISSSDDGTVKLWNLRTGEFIRNIVHLGSGGAGGNVLRIRASNTQLVCAVGSRNGTEETKLMLMNFDRKESCEKCSEFY